MTADDPTPDAADDPTPDAADDAHTDPDVDRHADTEQLDALLHAAAPDEVGRHVAGCQRCSDQLDAHRQVGDLLAAEAADPPAPPAGLADQLLGALPAAGGVPDGGLSDADPQHRDPRGPSGAVLPLLGGRDGERSGRTPRRALPWLAAAAGVVLLAGAAVAAGQVLPLSGTTSTESDDQSVAAAAGSAPQDATPVLQTGTAYTTDDLSMQVSGLLQVPVSAAEGQLERAGADAGAGAGTMGVPDEGPEVAGDVPDTTDSAAGLDASALSACLDALGEPDALPVVVDVATFDGAPALVLLLPTEVVGQVEAWVVPTGCGAGDDTLLAYQVVTG